MFKINQKVVCIKGFNGSYNSIVKDEIYKVTATRCLELGLEINVNNQMATISDKSWWTDPEDYFRPLDHSFGEKLASEIEEEINEEQLVIK